MVLSNYFRMLAMLPHLVKGGNDPQKYLNAAASRERFARNSRMGDAFHAGETYGSAESVRVAIRQAGGI